VPPGVEQLSRTARVWVGTSKDRLPEYDEQFGEIRSTGCKTVSDTGPCWKIAACGDRGLGVMLSRKSDTLYCGEQTMLLLGINGRSNADSARHDVSLVESNVHDYHLSG
jgi:hypothetical protein